MDDMHIPNTTDLGAATVGVAILNMFLQVVPESLPPWMNAAEHLTVSGLMLVLVVVLWRAYQRKDEALIASTKIVTEALASQTSSNVEMRKIVQESVEAKRDLKEAIDLLSVAIAKLPCTMLVSPTGVRK